MTTLSVSSVLLNLPKYIHERNVPVAVSSLCMAKSQYQIPERRNFGTSKRSSSFGWMATVGENVQSTAVPTSVPVRVAHELLQAGHRYLDVRTPEEFSAGHAVGAINVPYMFRVGSDIVECPGVQSYNYETLDEKTVKLLDMVLCMTKNANFLEEVLENFGKDDEIIVGCQVGKRSLMAATDLISAGFTGVTDIAGGYAAWVQNELPTES